MTESIADRHLEANSWGGLVHPIESGVVVDSHLSRKDGREIAGREFKKAMKFAKLGGNDLRAEIANRITTYREVGIDEKLIESMKISFGVREARLKKQENEKETAQVIETEEPSVLEVMKDDVFRSINYGIEVVRKLAESPKARKTVALATIALIIASSLSSHKVSARQGETGNSNNPNRTQTVDAADNNGNGNGYGQTQEPQTTSDADCNGENPGPCRPSDGNGQPNEPGENGRNGGNNASCQGREMGDPNRCTPTPENTEPPTAVPTNSPTNTPSPTLSPTPSGTPGAVGGAVGEAGMCDIVNPLVFGAKVQEPGKPRQTDILLFAGEKPVFAGDVTNGQNPIDQMEQSNPSIDHRNPCRLANQVNRPDGTSFVVIRNIDGTIEKVIESKEDLKMPEMAEDGSLYAVRGRASEIIRSTNEGDSFTQTGLYGINPITKIGPDGRNYIAYSRNGILRMAVMGSDGNFQKFGSFNTPCEDLEFDERGNVVCLAGENVQNVNVFGNLKSEAVDPNLPDNARSPEVAIAGNGNTAWLFSNIYPLAALDGVWKELEFPDGLLQGIGQGSDYHATSLAGRNK